MNLTLYHVLPMNDADRPIYIIAPDAETAAQNVRYFLQVRSITAVANNGYVGDTFPRLEEWEPPAPPPHSCALCGFQFPTGTEDEWTRAQHLAMFEHQMSHLELRK